MELYYKAGEIIRKDRTIPARTETVVVFLPDIRCCVPTRVEWDSLIGDYKQKVENIVTDHEAKSLGSGSGSNKRSSSNRKSTDNKSTNAADAVKEEPATPADEAGGDQSQITDTTLTTEMAIDSSNACAKNAQDEAAAATTATDKALAHFQYLYTILFKFFFSYIRYRCLFKSFHNSSTKIL